MNKIYFSFAILFCLLIMQSCQKENIDNDLGTDSELISTTRASKSQGKNKSDLCNKLYISSNTTQVTWNDYFKIMNKLKNPGFSISNCDEVFMNFNSNDTPNWEQKVEESVVIVSVTGSHITFYIDDLLLACYECYFGFPLCSEIGNGLDVVQGTSNSNCILGEFTFEYSQVQDILIGFSSYTNIQSCAVSYCPGDDGL